MRGALVSRIGEKAFRGVFVLVSFALLYWLGTAYGDAGPVRQHWTSPMSLQAAWTHFGNLACRPGTLRPVPC